MILKNRLIHLLIGLFVSVVYAQEIDADLNSIEQRLDSIESFDAQMDLELDVSFIHMPPKTAKIHYQKSQPLQFESEDFVMLPKRGLDFTMQKLFEYPFLTVDRGVVEREGVTLKQLSIIPQDKRADFAIATLLLDTQLQRIVSSEVNTKKHGTYTLEMEYMTGESALPDAVVISFEIEDLKLPIQYLSNKMDAEVDKEQLKTEQTKEGRIFLKLRDYKIRYK